MANLTVEVSAPGQQTHQSVASKLLALDDAELLSILTSLEEMDEATRAKFLAFATSATADELKHFGSLPPQPTQWIAKPPWSKPFARK
jgi:hypothetical protein